MTYLLTICWVICSGVDDHMKHPIYTREKIVKADYPEFCSYGPVVRDDPYKWEGVILGPLGSPYQDGLFFLSIDLPNEYPSKPPIITFLTKVRMYTFYSSFHTHTQNYI